MVVKREAFGEGRVPRESRAAWTRQVTKKAMFILVLYAEEFVSLA